MSFKLKLITTADDGSSSVVTKYINYCVTPTSAETKYEAGYKTYTPKTCNSQIFKNAVNGVNADTPSDKKRITNDNIIKNISFDQSEILWNIMKLYNNGEPFECDMTASELKFYGKGRGTYEIPVPKILFDVYPQSENVKKITPFNKLPLEDGSISSIVCDLPFVISPKLCKSFVEKKDGSCLIANRFSSFYPAEERRLSVQGSHTGSRRERSDFPENVPAERTHRPLPGTFRALHRPHFPPHPKAASALCAAGTA